MFKYLYKIYQNIFNHRPARKHKKPDIYFNSIRVTDKTPKNDQIGNKDFVVVVYENKPLWALFRCPCGCGHVISLSLQRIHKPHWIVKKTGTCPTLSPSVWQITGCRSHFIINEGRVYWCS